MIDLWLIFVIGWLISAIVTLISAFSDNCSEKITLTAWAFMVIFNILQIMVIHF